MPTYEYACKSCDQHLEVVQAFTDEPLTECPACGGQLRKVFGAVGISFKGSGFYKTDSAAKRESKSAPSETSSSEKSSSDKPSTDKPSTDKPASEKPASEKPVSDKSSKGSSDKVAS